MANPLLIVPLTPAGADVTVPLVPAGAQGVTFHCDWWGNSSGGPATLTSLTSNFAAAFTIAQCPTQGGPLYPMGNIVAWARVTSPGENKTISPTFSWGVEEMSSFILVFWDGIPTSGDWVRLTGSGGADPRNWTITSGPSDNVTGSIPSNTTDVVVALDCCGGSTPPALPSGWTSMATQTITGRAARLRRANSPGASTTSTETQTDDYASLGMIAILDGGGVPDETVPTLVGSITETGKTTTSISISWPAGSDNVAVVGYDVSSNGGSSWTQLGNVLSHTFSSLTAGTEYQIRVRARDAANLVSTPPLSTAITTLAPDTTNPTLVGSITVGAKTSTTISMSWPAGTDNVGVTSYEVSRDGGSTWTDVGNVLTHQFTGLTALTSYNLRVRAKDGAGLVSAPLAATTSTYRAGALGSTILLTTGPVDGNQAGILYNDVQAGDEGKWFSFYIVTPPATGTLDINPDGTFTFTGAEAATFTYQLEVDGAAFGDPVLVTLYNTTTYRPISDGTTTGWSTTGASFFGALNETPASDASYVTSPAVAGSPGPLVMGINPIAAGTYVARFRARRTLTVGEVRQVFLTSGDVQVGATAWQALTNSFALYEPTVTLTGTAAKVRLEVRE